MTDNNKVSLHIHTLAYLDESNNDSNKLDIFKNTLTHELKELFISYGLQDQTVYPCPEHVIKMSNSYLFDNNYFSFGKEWIYLFNENEKDGHLIPSRVALKLTIDMDITKIGEDGLSSLIDEITKMSHNFKNLILNKNEHIDIFRIDKNITDDDFNYIFDEVKNLEVHTV